MNAESIKYLPWAPFIVGVLYLMLASSFASKAWSEQAPWAEMNNQVIQLYRSGQYDLALQKGEEALSLAETDYGQAAPETSLSLNNLALVHKKLGQYNKAIVLYERSLAIGEKIKGKDHEDLLVMLNNMAVLYEAIGRQEKADRIYERIRKSGNDELADELKSKATEVRSHE
jgi:tetratricopeptide (TPR) repeat protein